MEKPQLTEVQDLKIPWRLSNLDFKDMNLSLQVFYDASKSSYTRQNFRLTIILPSNHPGVKALFIYKHVQIGHVGVQMLMYTRKESYWILKGRKTIKEVIKICIICKRFNAKPISVSEGLLPQDRVRDAAVFEIIVSDLAGPLILKNGENWILILTCAVYRAINLELLTSVSTESFLFGLNRFIARRGRPSVIYSDNGTNFKGAYRLYQKVPWWGGFWERLIGFVKRTLKKTLGKTSLNHEEMYTVRCDCESLINSRTLNYVTDNVEDLEHLTPAMFLQDIREIGVPELDQIDENKLNKRLVYRNRIQNDLRKRFRVEYLSQLRETRNIKGENTLSERDIVLVGDDHTKRINWNLDANKGSHLPINIDHELSKTQRTATSSMQPCSSISNDGAGLKPRVETSGHQQAETSSMQPCSNVSDGEAGVEPRLETCKLPDVLTSDGELQPPGPRRSRYGRLLKPRKGLNDYC
ncbi:integrase catalytic domain-containing protein [Trichonephila clavipes]|nr:integrase catalytic domain-containing protein [Trichonephila clavipes]